MTVISYYLIGIIFMLGMVSICLCGIMGSWRPLKSLAIAAAAFVVILVICYLVSMVLISRSSNSHWGWLGVILLMTNLTLNLLILIPPSILITHAIVSNKVSSETKKYAYLKTAGLFVVVLIIVFGVVLIAFKLIRRIF